MKTGPEFRTSVTAKIIDGMFRESARPLDLAVRMVLSRLIHLAPSELVVIEPRLSADGQEGTIRKYRTRDDKGDFINALTKLVEEASMDELAQLHDGETAVFGYRRMNPADHEWVYGNAYDVEGGPELLLSHQTIVGNAPHGYFSTFGFRFHSREQLDVMVRMRDNINDVLMDSVAYRMGMLATGISKIVQFEMDKIGK